MRQLEKEGLMVPGDVAVMGFDNIQYAAIHNPPLSTVAQPGKEMGRRAFDLLFQMMTEKERHEPGRIFLAHKLIKRYSTTGKGEDDEQ
jgi:DNA-binding LacI/PurR family transcriptional regulator